MPMSPKLRRVLVDVPLLAFGILVLSGFVLVFTSWTRPDDLGLVNGALRACPDSPNCVCSQESRGLAKIPPLSFLGGAEPALERLRDVLASFPNTTIVRDEDGYLHAESATPWLRFVDDIEFLLDEEAKVIHVRSASRVGYSDMGANRERVEQIRAAFVDAK